MHRLTLSRSGSSSVSHSQQNRVCAYPSARITAHPPKRDPHPPHHRVTLSLSLSILLTLTPPTSLTPSVLEEALSSLQTALILAYHPPLFKPLSSLTLANPLQSSLLRCAAAGISVYSPHTSIDNAQGGVSDWLVSGLAGKAERSLGGIDENTGSGRLVRLENSTSLAALVDAIKSHLGVKHGVFFFLPSPLTRRG